MAIKILHNLLWKLLCRLTKHAFCFILFECFVQRKKNMPDSKFCFSQKVNFMFFELIFFLTLSVELNLLFMPSFYISSITPTAFSLFLDSTARILS